MTLSKTALVSVMFLVAALVIAITTYGWSLGVIIIMFYISNVLDRRIAIITSISDLIEIKILKETERDTNGTKDS